MLEIICYFSDFKVYLLGVWVVGEVNFVLFLRLNVKFFFLYCRVEDI